MTGNASDQQQELARLRKEIGKIESELREHEGRERRSISNIQTYNKRTRELQSRLKILGDQAALIRSELRTVDASLNRTASSIGDLKENYANGVKYLYRSGALHEVDPDHYLFSPNDRSRASRNTYYSRLIGQRHASNYKQLDSTRSELTLEKQDLAADLNQQRSVIGLAAKERAAIEAQKQQEAKQLTKIQQDREKLKRELDKRRASAKRLEGIIANLIAREEAARKSALAKKKALAAKKRKSIADAGRKPTKKEEKELELVENVDVGNSAFRHNSLLWPTNSRKIKQGYGEVRNAELNTVTVNLGIDIAASPGSPVFAVADGVVSMISSLPNYGNLIILRHPGGFHTVYADLEGIAVRNGASVKAGQRIATTGENAELGGLLHFEVWKGRAKQNPLTWLR